MKGNRLHAIDEKTVAAAREEARRYVSVEQGDMENFPQHIPSRVPFITSAYETR